MHVPGLHERSHPERHASCQTQAAMVSTRTRDDPRAYQKCRGMDREDRDAIVHGDEPPVAAVNATPPPPRHSNRR